MYKLLAVDLDDTLLCDDVTVHPEVKKRITRIKDEVNVVISTGRMFRSALIYARELNLDGPMITYNGALVKSAGDGKIFFEETLPVELAEEILECGREKGIYANVYINDELFCTCEGEEQEIYHRVSGVRPCFLSRKLTDFTHPPAKLLFIHRDEVVIRKLEEELQGKYGSRTAITRSKPIFLEVVPQGITKGRALKELALELGISREEVVAVGDSPNDIAMLKWAGLGVAVANAQEEVKEVADYVTEATNNEGALKEVIDKFFLEGRDSNEN